MRHGKVKYAATQILPVGMFVAFLLGNRGVAFDVIQDPPS
jgi:hypothetical protein